MSLEQYRRKRTFDRTPEPEGSASPALPASLRRFVVGRHRATRLHYDLRLEIDGVLVSWALPRGPSMEPLAKRRAARTEDHPLEYLDFEGVIPKGEYGGGDAIVWDHGSWDPELDEDPADSLVGGELKFDLHGERLSGRFALVRTGVEKGKEDWILIRKREGAIEGWDIDDYRTSVLTGRTNEDVAAGVPGRVRPGGTLADIDLSRARPAGRAAFVQPMLASAVEAPFDDPDWLFELKLDGYRTQAVVRDGAAKLWTRKRVDAARYFPEFAAAAPDWIATDDAIVDGEMVALDPSGRPSFGLLQELSGMRGLGVKRRERRPAEADEAPPRGTLVYHAFDLLRLDGLELTDVPLEDRKRLLRLLYREHPSVRYVTHIDEHGTEFQAAIAAQGLEGSMAKHRRSRYQPGVRSREWLKIKARREQELVVIGYEPGQGHAKELGSVLVATHESDAWRFAGHVGSGIDARDRKTLRGFVEEAPLESSPAELTPPSDTARYCKPRHVIRAEFAEWTAEGLLRQATLKGFEPDRDPLTVVREEAVPAPTGVGGGSVAVGLGTGSGAALGAASETADASSSGTGTRSAAGRSAEAGGSSGPGGGSGSGSGASPVSVGSGGAGGGSGADAPDRVTPEELTALDGLEGGGRWTVGGHEVDLTNLDKVLFPEAGFTKRDLVRYYTSIAPVILPYLRERPLNVHRWPDGVGGKTQFWQKQIPDHAPAWVARWDYPEAGKTQSHTYVVADRVATMAWLANQACIDLHPWTSRLPDYRRPTYAYIDIDPGSETTWEELITLARLYRTALEHLGVRGYPKVSGKRGIQVWIHVAPGYTFDDTRDWVGGLSRGVGAVVPDLVSWEWSKSDRGGRARLDYTQNSFIKTLVAPYAVRPVPAGSVSAPIAWDELDDPELSAGRWDMRTIVDRVAQRGDLFAGVLTDPQELPAIT